MRVSMMLTHVGATDSVIPPPCKGEVGEQSEPGGGQPQRLSRIEGPPPDRLSLRSGAQPTLRVGVLSAKNGGREAAYAPPCRGRYTVFAAWADSTSTTKLMRDPEKLQTFRVI